MQKNGIQTCVCHFFVVPLHSQNNLSEKLTDKYGEGWSVEQLTLIRKFYMAYSKFVNTDYEIQNSDLGIAEHTAAKRLNTVYPIRNLPKQIDPSTMPNFTLSWSHYIVLMRIKNENERHLKNKMIGLNDR